MPNSVPTPLWSRVARIAREGRILVVTGAGISAESGIPTFRSKNGTGLYEKDQEFGDITELLLSRTVEEDLPRLWAYYLSRLHGAVKQASPNAAHMALGELSYFAGKRMLLVTQNIDGLHMRTEGPTERVIELHGNSSMRCAEECWLRNNAGVPQFWKVPASATREDQASLICPSCGGPSRPHVLLFDERYSQELYRSREAHEFAIEADLVITVGCSATVPVAQILANYAVVNNAVVIDVNPHAGSLASLAEQQGAWLPGTACEFVPALVQFLMG